MTRLLSFLSIVLFGGGCIKVGLDTSPADAVKTRVVAGDRSADPQIAVIPLYGVIAMEDEGGMLASGSSITPEGVRRMVERVAEEKQLVGVILDINSPGGSAAASEAILRHLRDFKATRRVPVVAHFRDVAASGGYMIAQAADWIVANPSSVTGSIGAVITFYSAEKLLRDKLAVEVTTIKAGRVKDIGSPFRTMTEEERGQIQRLVDEVHHRFVATVARSRKRPVAEIRALAEGQVYTGNDALQNGLVDETGQFEDAVARAKRLSRVTAAKVVRYEVPRASSGLSLSMSAAVDRLFAHVGQGAILCMWMPGR